MYGQTDQICQDGVRLPDWTTPEIESAEIEPTDNEDVDPGFSDFLNQIGH